jgi:D-glycero-D-manno-heptose 1,7-bisphosphate phosphatase
MRFRQEADSDRLPAVFIDKDGTLIEDIPFNADCSKIRLAPEAGNALRFLHQQGFEIILISNQSGIARGYLTMKDMETAYETLQELLNPFEVALTGFYFCPHDPQAPASPYSISCRCRKPQPGLIEKAASDHHIDLKKSWMIGDILDDVSAGRRAGCRTVLLDIGHETEWVISPDRVPDYRAENLYDAALFIGKKVKRCRETAI